MSKNNKMNRKLNQRNKKAREKRAARRKIPTKFVDVVYLEREKVDGVTQVFATCTCNKWRSSSEATTIAKVAAEAKEHVLAGDCVLRQHDE